jgi:cytochrome c-type biogenesis protein CcmE
MLFVAFALAVLALATFFALKAFNQNLLFYFTPTDVVTGKAPAGHLLRAGGMVKHGSIVREGLNVRFVITDFASDMPVVYSGVLPDLFKEDKGVIVRGKVDSGVFVAEGVLAKHDENYVPPEMRQLPVTQ